jgi:hypothetical protein
VNTGAFDVALSFAALDIAGIPAMQIITPSSHVQRIASSPTDGATSLTRTCASCIAGWSRRNGRQRGAIAISPARRAPDQSVSDVARPAIGSAATSKRVVWVSDVSEAPEQVVHREGAAFVDRGEILVGVFGCEFFRFDVELEAGAGRREAAAGLQPFALRVERGEIKWFSRGGYDAMPASSRLPGRVRSRG